MEHIYRIAYRRISNQRYPYHSLKDSFGSGQGRIVNAQYVSWFYDRVNGIFYGQFTLIIWCMQYSCSIAIHITLYLCPMLLSFVSWWKWSIVLFCFYAEGGELSWLCRHRWRRGCRFHNLRCRRGRQGRHRGGSLVSVSVFIVYYMYISHQSMTSPYYK